MWIDSIDFDIYAQRKIFAIIRNFYKLIKLQFPIKGYKNYDIQAEDNSVKNIIINM